MSKITYYLGAGASFHSCPILEDLSNSMFTLARTELNNFYKKVYNFNDSELSEVIYSNDNRRIILWYIGYFGEKAKQFNTIDTYARKLYLTKKYTKLSLLKMSLSVFFDLWENFLESNFNNLFKKYKSLDLRYINLLSILLENNGSDIVISDSLKFITWNYDLQIESTFKLFLEQERMISFKELDSFYFKFKENNIDDSINNVFHLNGHRGFISHQENDDELRISEDYKKYWNDNDWIYNAVKRKQSNFNNYIKYSWEHNLNNNWYNKISKVLNETEILVIVGYSFPPFNRKIDQYLFSKLNSNKVKKIVYQDPKANKQIIKNLFTKPDLYFDKIEIIDQLDNMNQFYFPNEYFISQKK